MFRQHLLPPLRNAFQCALMRETEVPRRKLSMRGAETARRANGLFGFMICIALAIALMGTS
jgi:hypothetical protein